MLNYNNFYQELGNLFFAIAAADGKISSEEKETLNDEIQYSWKHFEDSKDRFGSDLSYVIQYEFDTMEDSFETPDHAYESFEFFFKNSQTDIDKHTRKRIFYSCRHIAETVRKINTPELNFLVRLKKLLDI